VEALSCAASRTAFLGRNPSACALKVVSTIDSTIGYAAIFSTRSRDAGRTVIEGPFTTTRERVAGLPLLCS